MPTLNALSANLLTTETPGLVLQKSSLPNKNSNGYKTLCVDAAKKYEHGGIPFLRKRSDGVSLSDRLLIWWSKEDKVFNFDQQVEDSIYLAL